MKRFALKLRRYIAHTRRRPTACMSLNSSRCAHSTSTSGPAIALMFPGQGAQRVGMCKDLVAQYPEARAVVEEVDDALQHRLSRLMFEGPMEELSQTANTQPAILAHSVAVLRVMTKLRPELMPRVRCVLGHSVGEYAALVAAGSLSLRDAAVLLRARGSLMQEAARSYIQNSGVTLGMAAVLLSAAIKDASTLRACIDRAGALSHAAGGRACVAAVNSYQQVVLSGESQGVTTIADGLKQAGLARRMVKLPVSAPFHSHVMEPARSAFESVLSNTALQTAQVPLITNVDAVPTCERTEIVSALSRGITQQVRWCEDVLAARGLGVDLFLEMGPGKPLSALVKDVVHSQSGDNAGGARVCGVSDAADLDAVLPEVSVGL